MENRYLRRRAMHHHDMRMRDRRRDMYNRMEHSDYRRSDTPAGGMYGRGMGRGSYYPESSSDMARRYDRYSSYSDGYFGGERYTNAQGHMHDGMYNDMREDYRDYKDYNYDYAKEDEEYHRDIHDWIHKMKSKDRFNWSKQQVIESARQMGVQFDNFDEDEYYAIYLAMVTDYKSLGNEPRIYLTLAKEWLNDDDTMLRGSEKVCAYLYNIVKGEM